MKFKTYTNEELYNVLITYKIDGVRAHKIGTNVVSRTGKPLYNIPPIYDVCEVFLGSWEKTVSYVRTEGLELLDKDYLYSLDPIDPRLIIETKEYVNKELVTSYMNKAISLGYEGLVLYSDEIIYKVKPIETFDLPVIGIIPGKGKHIGKMGALLTPMGKVGTGFTDEQRTYNYTNKIIEVEAMSVTPKGMLRHPRFKRVRTDKE